jgi:hypothetical protein
MNKGQSLFELILAIGISALIIVSIVSLVNNSLQNAAFSRNEGVASKHAQGTTEWLRGQRDNRIDYFIARTATASWCLTDANLTDSSWNNQGVCGANEFITGTIFRRQLDFTRSVVGGKNIYRAVVTVTWTDSKGAHNVNSATDFTDWRQR